MHQPQQNSTPMALFDIFLSPEKKKGKSHLRNLLSMALADGQIDASEFIFLLTVAKRYTISVQEVEQMKAEITKKGVYAVEKGSTAFEQIFDLVNMMMIDNNINPNELKICKNFAKRIGFHISKVDELIECIVQNISIGHSAEETKMRVSYLMK